MPNASARNARPTAKRKSGAGLAWIPAPDATDDQAQRLLQAQSMFYGTQAESLQELLPEKLAAVVARHPRLTPGQVRLHLLNQRNAWRKTLPFMAHTEEPPIITEMVTVKEVLANQ